MNLHIAIVPEKIAEFAGIPITNTLVTSIVVTIALSLFAFFFSRAVSLRPGRIQNFIEMIFEYIYEFMEEVLGSRKLVTTFFPLVATLFLFIWTSNWMEFIPGMGSFGIEGECGKSVCEPLLRSVNTDLNVTIALAVISVIVTEIAGIRALGFSYMKKFFNFSGPLNFFIGLIELVSEITRLVSFSFRLFGNVFAGEVLILVLLAFLPVALPVPFMLFELFVGFIQAAIFALLTLFFIKIAITPQEHH